MSDDHRVTAWPAARRERTRLTSEPTGDSQEKLAGLHVPKRHAVVLILELARVERKSGFNGHRSRATSDEPG
jgi:hypothetical protein